ncbi:glycosyltransferase involved in cell wall biosynthesis [Flavobacterium sp. CG_9.10]|uniref:glycosyltransferase family 4 protein n=1 Tax=Flavobacterium sp. CG_9.10 TaxID=2787729 RepID=UPI001A2BF31E|nr:glycosyltransferase family 4 protein [Flavobacterium sp. CG_9.10]MBG6109797.1 glycosyltransferase involved in cell wall biosynthesis [Flavobacterium sp. CG_9.10]
MVISEKKIAILCNYELVPERVGGMDYFFWQFDAKCKENGFEVDWFFPNRSHHGDYSNLTILESNGLNLEIFFLETCKSKQLVYSHIITHFVELCTPFFYKLKQLSSAKIIVIDHNPRPIAGYPLKKRLEKKVKGILFSRYIDLFVGVSNYTVSEILKDFGSHLKNKTIIIYNGVLIKDIKVRVNRNVIKPTFMVVSHLRESKGIQDLIQAVSQLEEPIKSEIKIAVFGDGPYKDVLIQLIKDKGLTGNFQLMGSKSNLNELLCQYDYMLQPTHMECFSLSILESLAANVPVITTNVGGNEEVITTGENGFITTVKEINLLQDVLKKVYLGESKITKNTRTLIVDSFSLEKMVENHLKIIY